MRWELHRGFQHTPSILFTRTLANQSCNVGGQPADETDSDCNCTSGSPCGVCVNLPTDNSQDMTIDCGYVRIPCTGQIGDFVWKDLNGNGCQDAGEPGIPNVKVDLYAGCGDNAVLDQSTITDANGKYRFANLCAGEYTVAFSTPNGFTRTLANQSCNVGGQPADETDSDCNCAPGSPCGVCVILPADNSQDLTIDCGYVPSLTLQCPTTGSGQVGVLYNSALVANGGLPPYTFSITAGFLPPGLTLNPSTGAITGTPTEAGNFVFTAQVVDFVGGVPGTTAVNCGITIIIGVGGCRVTGGSNKQLNSYQSACITTTPPSFVSHGGQVGAALSLETPFSPNSVCISGEWQHNRHLKQNSLVGTFHAGGNGHERQFDSLLCACLPCDQNPNSVGVVGAVCNPGDRICGPEPRRAPANKICFSGVGDYTFTTGKKTVKAVFRVDIEDRSEGNSHASSAPPDRYRIRLWLLDPSCGRNPDPNSAEAMAIRFAASADPATIGTLATTEQLKVNILPDIDDGGDMTQGNHQIHPATGAVCKP